METTETPSAPAVRPLDAFRAELSAEGYTDHEISKLIVERKSKELSQPQLEKREDIKLLHDGFWKMWTIYMTWFSWFFATSLIGVGWVIIGLIGPTVGFAATSGSVDRWFLMALAVLWIICTLAGLTATFEMRSYNNKIKSRVSTGAFDFFAINITDWAWKGTGIALTSLLVVWVIVLSKTIFR